MSAADGKLRLSVSDDGKGFDAGTAGIGEGLGLLSMRERVRLVDGQIRWQSAAGVGTRVDVQVPLPPPGAAA